MASKYCIVICGPTASGKTSLAIDLASRFQTEILSADSRQCYRELNIGVAKPSVEERKGIVHHFIDSHSVTENIHAADFEQYALLTAEKVFLDKDHLIVTGGTGLYIKAFLEGLDVMPAIPANIRTEVRQLYREHGLNVLQETVRREDPDFTHTGEMENPHRLMRALEVKRTTGHSILVLRKKEVAPRNFRILQLGLTPGRDALYQRINARVDEMMDAGLEAEVRGLLPYRHLKALQTVGYRELIEYMDGLTTLDVAVSKIKQHTRNYAKRQMTWFRAQPGIHWFDPADREAILDFLAKNCVP